MAALCVAAIDDTKVEYTCLLTSEERRRRFSEVLVDRNMSQTIRVEKMFRRIQRQVYCSTSFYNLDQVCIL